MDVRIARAVIVSSLRFIGNARRTASTPSGDIPWMDSQADLIAVGCRDDADFSSTELFRTNSNCLKYRLKIVWRSGDRLQHLRRGALLFARFIQLANA